MATAEAASAALGPRYAPDDPTLPKPWKGLIDGSTGLLYYWNPETNVTQYEKPAASPPLPAVSAPNLAHSVQPGGVAAQHGQQQLMQTSHQQLSYPSQQHGQQASQGGQQQSSQSLQSMQQSGLQQFRQQQQQMLQPMSQQIPPQQMHHQMSNQDHGSYMGQPQAHQFGHQNAHYMAYSQNMHSNGLQSSQPTQHNMHGQPLENHQQEFKPAFSKMEDVDFKNGSQAGLSPSQYQQTSALPPQSNQNIPAGISSAQGPRVGVNAGQAQPFSAIPNSMQQPSAAMKSQQGSADLIYQYGHNFQNQIGPGMMHGQPSNVHPVDLKMGHEDSLRGRAVNEYNYNSGKDMPSMGSQQPSIAPIPTSRNQQAYQQVCFECC